jgi:hypothetical protein
MLVVQDRKLFQLLPSDYINQNSGAVDTGEQAIALLNAHQNRSQDCVRSFEWLYSDD